MPSIDFGPCEREEPRRADCSLSRDVSGLMAALYRSLSVAAAQTDWTRRRTFYKFYCGRRALFKKSQKATWPLWSRCRRFPLANNSKFETKPLTPLSRFTYLHFFFPPKSSVLIWRRIEARTSSFMSPRLGFTRQNLCRTAPVVLSVKSNSHQRRTHRINHIFPLQLFFLFVCNVFFLLAVE